MFILFRPDRVGIKTARVDREIALRPSRNRQGVFAGLDAIHYPRNIHRTGEVIEPSRPLTPPSDSSRARVCLACLPRRVRPLPRSAYRFLRGRWRLDLATERPHGSRRQGLYDTHGKTKITERLLVRRPSLSGLRRQRVDPALCHQASGSGVLCLRVGLSARG